jgi:hypothetical protein
MIVANMDYFDKYQRLDDHPGQSLETEKWMETPISSVVLSGTPIEEHAERITMEMLVEQPNAFLGETIHMLLGTDIHESVYANGGYRAIITHSATSEESSSMGLGNVPHWRISFSREILVIHAISLWVGAAEMEELLVHKIYGNEEYRDEATIECCAMRCFAESSERTDESCMQELSPTEHFIMDGGKRPAQDDLNMSLAMPANVQVIPDMNQPLSKAALEKHYEELCSQINAYHVVGSPLLVMLLNLVLVSRCSLQL